MSAGGAPADIRRMTPADLDRVMEIAASLREAPQWPVEAYLAALDPGRQPRRIALVAESAERGIAGFAVASLIPPQAELEVIAVAKETQRRGVARHLLRSLAAEMTRAQVTEVTLEVRASNSRAWALYTGDGFAEIARRSCYYADPIEDALLMRRALDGP